MKVCIVTVYNGKNCGSYMQAYALAEKINELGHEVTFFERNFFDFALLKNSIKSILKLNFKQVSANYRIKKQFSKCLKKFNITKNNSESIANIDCFVLGSDTIWNLDNKHFEENYELFWGLKFKGKPVISYAASIANTTEETVRSKEYVKEALDNLNYIAVRDEHTYNVINKLTDKDLSLVCDPTFLFDKNKYENLINDEVKGGYILIYWFFKMEEKTKNDIIKFARENNKKIISFRTGLLDCDLCVDFEPESFLKYYKNADFVITNTFHGTLFSIIFNKNFVSFGKGKNKVVDVLNRLGLDRRNVSDEDEFCDILKEDISWDNVESILVNWRNYSINYLKNSLENLK